MINGSSECLLVKASIIILTKNVGEKFRLLLERIHSQTFRDFEVLVIDSGSEDSTLKIAEEYGSRIYRIRPEEFHHSKTRNFGASLAEGEILVYITQDALPINNCWLKNLITPLENDKNIAVAYGRQIAYPTAKPTEKFFYNYFYPKERKILTCKDAEDPGKFYLENVFTSDVNSAIKKGIWEEIRFREDLIMAEDKEFALRALRKGWNMVYEPEACVYHSHNYSIFSVFKRRFEDGIAYKQITGGSNLVGNYAPSYLRNYLLPEFKFLWEKHKSYFLYGLLYEVVKVLGFAFGVGYHSLVIKI